MKFAADETGYSSHKCAATVPVQHNAGPSGQSHRTSSATVPPSSHEDRAGCSRDCHPAECSVQHHPSTQPIDHELHTSSLGVHLLAEPHPGLRSPSFEDDHLLGHTTWPASTQDGVDGAQDAEALHCDHASAQLELGSASGAEQIFLEDQVPGTPHRPRSRHHHRKRCRASPDETEAPAKTLPNISLSPFKRGMRKVTSEGTNYMIFILLDCSNLCSLVAHRSTDKSAAS